MQIYIYTFSKYFKMQTIKTKNTWLYQFVLSYQQGLEQIGLSIKNDFFKCILINKKNFGIWIYILQDIIWTPNDNISA